MVNHEHFQPQSSPDQQGGVSPEKSQHLKPKLEGRLSTEIIGKYHLFLTDDCHPKLAEELHQLKTEQDVAQFIAGLKKLYTRSRRAIFLHRMSGSGQGNTEVGSESGNGGSDAAVFKRKAMKPLDKDFPGLDVSRFTTDVFHEMQTTYALIDIFERRAADLPHTLIYQGEQYEVAYQIQKPWGALVNTEDPTQKFGIFEYIQGNSFRDEIMEYEHWNLVPEEIRKFHGQLHVNFNAIARICVLEEGLEPRDTGAHQVLYSVDKNAMKIRIGIIDTEEFNFSSDGQHWPEQYSRIGMPSLIFEMLINTFAQPDILD